MSTYRYLYFVTFACLSCLVLLISNNKPRISINNEFNQFPLVIKNNDKNVTLLNNQSVTPQGMFSWLNKLLYARLQYILIWPNGEDFPFSEIPEGQEQFISLNCPVSNCFVTTNKNYFQDIRKFDAIVFMGQALSKDDLPSKRGLNQKYIFFSMESSPNYPLEDKIFDEFFNWTATYRLDSDIPLPYIQIKDKDGNVVGPKKDMHWLPEVPFDSGRIQNDILSHKTRAAAIFYSNCQSLSDREQVIVELSRELKQFGLRVHVYGACGPFKCLRLKAAKCNEMLGREYFFYLSYENSFDKDYVTEKLLTPLQNNVVPIVYGGANYCRYLPPRSYLDATEMSAWKLAKKIVELMTSPKKYLQYFWWKQFYTYHDPIANVNMCNICAAINNKKMWKTKTYKNFRKWWNVNGYD